MTTPDDWDLSVANLILNYAKWKGWKKLTPKRKEEALNFIEETQGVGRGWRLELEYIKEVEDEKLWREIFKGCSDRTRVITWDDPKILRALALSGVKQDVERSEKSTGSWEEIYKAWSVKVKKWLTYSKPSCEIFDLSKIKILAKRNGSEVEEKGISIDVAWRLALFQKAWGDRRGNGPEAQKNAIAERRKELARDLCEHAFASKLHSDGTTTYLTVIKVDSE